MLGWLRNGSHEGATPSALGKRTGGNGMSQGAHSFKGNFMSIKALFISLFAVTLVILGLVFASIFQVKVTAAQLKAAQQSRYDSYLLADELRQSSDDLTRLARTYVVTGDERNEQEYADIIAVRNGDKARADGQTVSLLKLMEKAGFTAAEFAKLKQAEDLSNELAKVENAAMHMVKGQYDDGNGGFTQAGEPDLERARALMHDQAYQDTKAAIMKPISEFFVLLDQRTEGRVLAAEKANGLWTGIAVTSIVATLVVLLGALLFAFRRIIGQLGGEPRDVVKAVERIANGDLQTPIALRPGDTSSLVHSLRGMQGSLKSIVADIQSMAEAAVRRGDFSVKMDSAGRAGFMKDIAGLLNELSDVTEAGLQDISRVSGALSAGDLSQKIGQDYPGLFGHTASAVNHTVAVLAGLVDEIRTLADSAGQGDFSRRIGLDGKEGFGQEIGRLLNQLSVTTDAGLRDVLRVAQALAQGDLTQRIDTEYPGLFGQVHAGMNATVANLHHLVQQIKDDADQIGLATTEIANGNQDLSARTETLAANLEETAASMEELTSTVRDNELRVARAGDITHSATDVAARGGEIVKASIVTMDEIAHSSRQIAEIISVIDGIAFQTNILALNAAVEAARASEHGRGFAVVASEVRSLAQRSAEAAKDIKNLITEAVAKAENGTERVHRVGDAMDEIVTGIGGVTAIMSEILLASREQSSGISQVAQSTTQMDEVTQSNAALVEEVAAAATSLHDRAQSLLQSVSAFNLGSSLRLAA
jgi:methyl-accepting chemotaxis protein